MKHIHLIFLSAVLISATSSTVFAYSLSPPNTNATLEGKLRFHPRQGQPITCEVTFGLKTKTAGHSVITSTKISHRKCSQIFAGGFPWTVTPSGPNTGIIHGMIFIGVGSGCGDTEEVFGDNGSGIFTFNMARGQCLSGTMTSSPPITIVP